MFRIYKVYVMLFHKIYIAVHCCIFFQIMDKTSLKCTQFVLFLVCLNFTDVTKVSLLFTNQICKQVHIFMIKILFTMLKITFLSSIYLIFLDHRKDIAKKHTVRIALPFKLYKCNRRIIKLTNKIISMFIYS